MKVEVSIADAICSKPIPYGGIGTWGFPEELTPFTGNQWNENWSWDARAVGALTDPEKLELWHALKRGGPIGGTPIPHTTVAVPVSLRKFLDDELEEVMLDSFYDYFLRKQLESMFPADSPPDPG